MKTKFEFDNIYDKDSIVGLPMSPGNFIGDFETMPISIIKMTCGGGIGGAQWKVYAERIPFGKFTESDSRFMLVKNICGEEVLINLSYVVDVNNTITLHKILFDNKNSNFELGKFIYDYLAKDGVKLAPGTKY